VALTVLFGPIGLIKHGKHAEIPAGTALTAFVERRGEKSEANTSD